MKAEVAGPPISTVQGPGPLTLGGFLEQVCARTPEREALVFDDPLRDGVTVRWTYGELLREARAVACALIAAGVRAGDRVAVLMANRPEAVAAYFGMRLGGRGRRAAVNVRNRPGAQPAAGTRRAGHRARADAHGAAQLRRRSGKARPARWFSKASAWDAFRREGAAVSGDERDRVSAAVTPDDDGLIIFSSGTTAKPKGVVHVHRAPTLQFWVQRAIFGRTPRTRLWSALPMFWTAGLNTAMGATLAAGGCWVMQEGFDAGHALTLMARERVTEPYTLPHQARALEEHPAWSTTDLSSLREVFGKSVFTRHPSVHGDPDWQMPVGWGMSETCAFISAHRSDAGREAVRRSLGAILPGVEVKVVDPDTGDVMDIGCEGELLVRGPMLMRCYLGKTPAECFDDDGWFHTGDVGHLDERGELHWTGRRTEMIRTGGAMVSPAEIEVQMRACPDVRLARVIGMPDERLDQIAVLCVELTEGSQARPEYLQAFSARAGGGLQGAQTGDSSSAPARSR